MPKNKNWKVFSRKIVHKNPWFHIVKENIRYPDGHRGDYYIFEGRNYKNFVVVIPAVSNSLYLVKQWRPTLKRYLLEFVAGGIEKKETSLQAAKRELLEETGLKAQEWIYLGKAAVGPGHSKEYGQVYLAEELSFSKKKVKKESNERTELIKIARQRFEQMIYNREIEDGPTLSAYLLYLTRKQKS